jgi:glycerophosphoryl diester phosphodiesterase
MPENTIPAFLMALDSGVTTIELDLAVTKDQQLVVSHEPWMSAAICLTPEGLAVSPKEEKKHNIHQMTYAEVAAWDCGSVGNKDFPEQQKIEVSKPLLSDVIKAVEDHLRSYTKYEVDYNIEIKSMPEGDNLFHPTPEKFADMVIGLVDQYLPLERVTIQSFDFRVLRYIHKQYPQVRMAALVSNLKSPEKNLADLGFNPEVYSPHFKLLGEDKVKALHDKKIRVIPWTVNEPDDMQKMKAMGVDGFITDYPNRARQLGLGLKALPPAPPNGSGKK